MTRSGGTNAVSSSRRTVRCGSSTSTVPAPVSSAPTLYLHAPDARMPRGVDSQHAHVPVHAGLMDLNAVLKLLGERGINEVQVEAGATLAGAFLAAGLVDELLLYVAPVMLGERARPLFEGLHIDAMTERLAMTIVETRRIGEDVRVLLAPKPLR